MKSNPITGATIAKKPAQPVERYPVEGRSDWIPRDRKNTQGPQITEGKGTTFALQTARSSCGSDDHF